MTVYPESTQIGDEEQPFLGLDLAHKGSRVPFGAFTEMTNCYVDHRGVIRIRPGIEKVSLTEAVGQTWPATWDGVFILKNSKIGQTASVIVINGAPTVGTIYKGNEGVVNSTYTRYLTESGGANGDPVMIFQGGYINPIDSEVAFFAEYGVSPFESVWLYVDSEFNSTYSASDFYPNFGESVTTWNWLPIAIIRPPPMLYMHGRLWLLDDNTNTVKYGGPNGPPGMDDTVLGFLTGHTEGGNIVIPPDMGQLYDIFSYRESLILCCQQGLLRLSDEGPESDWDLDYMFTGYKFFGGGTINDLMYLIAQSGVYVSDGVSLKSITDLLDFSIGKVFFFQATEKYVFIGVRAVPRIGVTTNKMLIYTIDTNTWAEIDRANTAIGDPFREQEVQYPFDNVIVALAGGDSFQSGTTHSPQARALFFCNNNQTDETVDPYLWYMPLYHMDSYAGGIDVGENTNQTPSYEDDGVDLTVTLRTGDYDFGMPEKNKEITFVEFQTEGAMGGDVVMRYYINGSDTPSVTETISLTDNYKKTRAPGTCRTLAIELEFQPDDWSVKDGTFGITAIGFNVETVSDVPS